MRIGGGLAMATPVVVVSGVCTSIGTTRIPRVAS